MKKVLENLLKEDEGSIFENSEDLKKLFVTVCIVVLLRNIEDLVPDYVLSKVRNFNTSIWYFLDNTNKDRVLSYFEKLGISNILEKVGIV